MTDEEYMKVALDEAIKGKGKVEPNPMVGCLIVEDGEIVAKAYHEEYGGLHAERNALNQLERDPKEGAVMYVTLEPCCTVGKTNACTDYIIRSGIKKVVVGIIDANPSHNGTGIDILRRAGIEVKVGILQKKCRDLNANYNACFGQ